MSSITNSESKYNGPKSSGNLLTNRWYIYKGKMNPEASKSLKLFKCADTPIADEIAEYLGVEVNDMKVTNFADGETSVRIDSGVRGKKAYIVCSTTSADRIMELLLATSAMRRASAKRITAVIPFYGYGRQDRMARGRQPIAAADVARMLEVVGINQVVTLDMHSSQIEGFYQPRVPVDNLKGIPVGAVRFAEYEDLQNPVVVAPHASAVHNAVSFRENLAKFVDEDVSLALAARNLMDKTKLGEVIGDVKDRDCIVVDTLVDTGKTLIDVSKLLKANGARRVYAFCVHGRFSNNAYETIEKAEELDFLLTTNSIPHINHQKIDKESKIQYVSIAPFLAQVISCIHSNGSISRLVPSIE